MYKSQFWKMYTKDLFFLSRVTYYNKEDLNKLIQIKNQRFGVCKIFFKEMKTFIQQGCVKLTKSPSKWTNNVKNSFEIQINYVF